MMSLTPVSELNRILGSDLIYLGRAPSSLTIKNSALSSFVEDVKLFMSALAIEDALYLFEKSPCKCTSNQLYLNQ
jgi:hypothetical protein